MHLYKPDFKCDKCGGTNVLDHIKERPQIEPEPKLMSSYKGPSMICNAVYYMTNGVLVCTDCGNRHEYSY